MGKVSPRQRQGILECTNHALVKGGVGGSRKVNRSGAIKVKVHHESKDGLKMMEVGGRGVDERKREEARG